MPVRNVIEVDTGSMLVRHARRLLADGQRLALVAAHHDGDIDPGGEAIRVVYLFVAGPPDTRTELVLRANPKDPHIPSLASLSFPASRFEREMLDLYGVQPDDHPMPRPLVHHPRWPDDWHPMRHDAGPRPALERARPFPFLSVEGDGVYEVPVGPVHAGIIEPGHFRLSVVGETVLKLKARLWYVHKGIEKLLEGKHFADGVTLAERVSGDTAVGHALAFSLAVEDALGVDVPEPVTRIRAVLLELERLHNHIADIGGLCNDVAYGIANAHAQRIRERLLRLGRRATGHRLLRGGVFPGGAMLLDVPDPAEIREVAADAADVVDIALHHSVIRERFTGTAVLTTSQARDIGAVGVVAKASGLPYDARLAHPHHDLTDLLTSTTYESGDVLARFLTRADEVRTSAAILEGLLPQASATRIVADMPSTHATAAGVGIAEGWRGAIVHRVEVSGDRLMRVKIVDPSFLNWPGLPLAMKDTIVPDFPLANKSFNLSYAGNDL